MKEINISSEDLIQIGLGQEQIKQFLNSKTTDKKIRLLEHHRKNLLDNIHFKEHQITTLDYFTYKISHSIV